MTTPYLLLPGTAAEALRFYAEVFGGESEMHTFAEFGTAGAPADGIAHGELRGAVSLFAADASGDEVPFQAQGLLLALLGTGTDEQSKRWFAALAEGGTVVNQLQRRDWGDWDGVVRDRYGVSWLIGFTPAPDLQDAPPAAS